MPHARYRIVSFLLAISCTSCLFQIDIAAAEPSTWNSIGLEGATINTLAIDPKTPTTLYAGTDRGGLFKSTNGGKSWSLVNTGLPNTYFSALAIDPKTPTTLYVAAAGGYAGLPGEGVFKSTDGGQSWRLMRTGLPDNAWVFALAIDPASPNTLYVGTGYGVFKSKNGGESWSDANSGLDSQTVRALAIDPTDPATIYAGKANGVFKSTNGGATWTASKLDQSKFLLAIVVDSLNSSNVYAGSSLFGLYKSADGGESWEAINTGLRSSTDVGFALAIDPMVTNTIYVGTSLGVFKSINGGESWNTLNAGIPPKTMITAIIIDPTNPGKLYAGTHGSGVFAFH